jgi:hypothetical protein
MAGFHGIQHAIPAASDFACSLRDIEACTPLACETLERGGKTGRAKCRRCWVTTLSSGPDD